MSESVGPEVVFPTRLVSSIDPVSSSDLSSVWTGAGFFLDDLERGLERGTAKSSFVLESPEETERVLMIVLLVLLIWYSFGWKG